MTTLPHCPMCRSAKHVSDYGNGVFFCHLHKMQFDPRDDGTTGYGSPEKYAERREEYQLRQQQRIGGQRR